MSSGLAVALWRGPGFAGFIFEQWAQDAVRRLEELRLVAREHLVEARLALGEQAELVGELEALVREQALRERPRGPIERRGRRAFLNVQK